MYNIIYVKESTKTEYRIHCTKTKMEVNNQPIIKGRQRHKWTYLRGNAQIRTLRFDPAEVPGSRNTLRDEYTPGAGATLRIWYMLRPTKLKFFSLEQNFP